MLPSPALSKSNIYKINTDLLNESEPVCTVNDTEISFKINSFYSQKHEKAFIGSVKRMIRSSIEYKEWRKFLIKTYEMTRCLFTGESLEECTIEFHHHPISLQNIIISVIDKYMEKELSFSSYDISNAVMIEHFSMHIGVVPMVTTLHEKFHNGFLNIPINFVIGDYNEFLSKYPIRDEMYKLVKHYETIKDTNYKGWK